MSKAPTQVGTSTTTTNNTVPPYIEDAQKNLMGAAANLTLPFASNVPAFTVAGFNPDQEMAFTLARNNAEQAFTQTPMPAQQFDAAQLDAPGIRNLFNPYQEDVVNTTTDQLTRANDKQLAAIRARQAAEGAYGGNRAALETSEQNRNFGDTLAHTVAGLNQTGWNSAANLGMGNTQLRQQAGATNAQQRQQADQFGAQQTWQQKMQALQALLGVGGQQQDLTQRAIDVPYTALDRFRATVPGAASSSSSTSQPIHGPSTFQSLLPIGLGLAGLLSDRTMKTDIQKLGKDPQTDLDLYAYRYKGDAKNTPKVVGPMAQDVEKKFPGSTARIGGKMVIKGDAARKILGL